MKTYKMIKTNLVNSFVSNSTRYRFVLSTLYRSSVVDKICTHSCHIYSATCYHNFLIVISGVSFWHHKTPCWFYFTWLHMSSSIKVKNTSSNHFAWQPLHKTAFITPLPFAAQSNGHLWISFGWFSSISETSGRESGWPELADSNVHEQHESLRGVTDNLLK